MKWLIKYREDGCQTKEKQYNTERGLKKKLEELNNNPLVVSIDIYKKVTYGDQLDLFDAKNSPF